MITVCNYLQILNDFMDVIQNLTRQDVMSLVHHMTFDQHAVDAMIRSNVVLASDLNVLGADYEQCLWTALSVGRWNMVFYILDVMAPLSDPVKFKLAFASMNIHQECTNDCNAHFKLRFKHGVNFNVCTSEGLTPLNEALRVIYKPGIYFLLNSGLGLQFVSDVTVMQILDIQDVVLLRWFCKKCPSIDFVSSYMRCSVQGRRVSPMDMLLTRNVDQKFFIDAFVFLCQRFGKPHLYSVPSWLRATYMQYNTLFYTACSQLPRHQLTELKQACNLYRLRKN